MMTIKSNNWVRVFCFVLLIVPVSAVAQTLDLSPNRLSQLGKEVEVYPLASDSLVSSFLIYVNAQVKPHYHAEHSEHVMVIEGQGSMTLNDSIFTVNPGDLIFIPRGSVHSVIKISEASLKVISIQAPYFDGKDRVQFPPKR
jgi:mannose-6-phosphate isomerase-like protein (cupin superfamily)